MQKQHSLSMGLTLVKVSSANLQLKTTLLTTSGPVGRIDDPSLPWAAMIKRMITDGHQVASHSWSHADLSLLNETDRTEEMVSVFFVYEGNPSATNNDRRSKMRWHCEISLGNGRHI